jgi:outer membrane protein assembly factor BamB
MEETESTFDKFSVEMGDYEVKKTSKFDRMWKVGPGGSIAQIPLVHDGLVYFGCCNYNLYAVDARKGELVWKYKTDGIIFASSPSYWNGKVYIGSYDYFLYAIDAKTGKLAWKYETDGEVDVKPVIADGLVYFASRDNYIYCVDAQNGKLKWKFKTYDAIDSFPNVVNGKFYVGSFDRFFYCVDAKTGKLVWKIETQGEIHNQNPITVHEGVVYFASFDNYLYAADAGTGNVIWKLRTGQYGNTASPVIYKDVLYINTRDGTLFAITKEGKVLWKVSKKTMMSIPVVFEDRIYIGGDDEHLSCLDLDGKELWRFKAQDIVWLQASFHERLVIFSSWDCNVYAVDIDTHELAWKFRASGSPSFLPPPMESFELQMKIRESDFEESQAKAYDISMAEEAEDVGGHYKSTITYRVSTRYASKGKYQVNRDEEEF